jgi:hypothetical protein
MAVIVLRSVKGSPLTIAEADANFSNLNTEVGLKLDATDYNAADVLTKIKTVDGASSGLDADLLDGLNASNSHVTSTATIVSRDTSGNFSANTITANLVGNVTGNITGNLTGTVTGNATNVSGVVAVNNGGTGATTVTAARTALGLGTIAVQNTSDVNITGGVITGITDLAIADGGTGASNVTQARTNLGLVIGTDVQPFNNQLTAFSALSTNGLVIKSGTASAVSRSIAGSSSIVVTNGDGVAGNPTLSLNTSIANQVNSLLGITNGLVIKNGAESVVSRSIAAGNSITVTNGDGVSGNPTIALNSAPVISSIEKSGTNGVGDIGQTGNRFGTIFGTATSARYADLAEKYTTDKEYEAGTVVVVSYEDSGAEATASWLSGQRVLGVISTNPAFLMNDEADGQAIALRGRVPVKVVGPIRKGQPLISNQDGCGIYSDHQNSFAIALESNQDAGVKLVECVIL